MARGGRRLAKAKKPGRTGLGRPRAQRPRAQRPRAQRRRRQPPHATQRAASRRTAPQGTASQGTASQGTASQRTGFFVGTDVGGTFTDLWVADGGQARVFKSPTTPDVMTGVIDVVKIAAQ